MHKRLAAALAAIAFLCAACAQAQQTSPELVVKDGDRVVFLGDSITQQMIYTRYVMNYFALRYPDMKVSFRNAGWSGDRASGALARLQRDVLDLKPNVVTICLGMNDARYQPFDQETYDSYIKDMKSIVFRLKEAGVRVVLLTPGCVDPDARSALKNYNDTLARFADGVIQLAKEENLPYYDIHTLMLSVQNAAKAANPQFTMIPDGVHPSEPGHALMASGLLQALGCRGGASSAQIMADRRTASLDRCRLLDLKITENSVTFRRVDDALPSYFDPEASAVFEQAPSLVEMNSYILMVNGLKDGKWRLAVDGAEVGTFSYVELDMGVDLADKPGPWQAVMREVNRTSKKQENVYFARWRQVQLAGFPEEAKPETDALLKKLDTIIANCEKFRAKAVANRTWSYSLTFVEP